MGSLNPVSSPGCVVQTLKVGLNDQGLIRVGLKQPLMHFSGRRTQILM